MNSTTGHGETHTNLAIRNVPVAGAAAGTTIAPAGWTPGSSLKSVINTTGWVNLTAQFSPTADGTGIVNAGGTSTAGATLLVLFIAAHPGGASLNRS